MATCHLSPCRSHQARLWLGQPLADQALKFTQVFGKPLLSLEKTFAPFTRGHGGLAASMGAAAQEGPDCVPGQGTEVNAVPCHQAEVVPTEPVWTRRWLLFLSGPFF